jgi:outer membrane lipoprotein-sorting protein
MQMSSGLVLACSTAVAVLAPSASVYADAGGDAVLAQMDAAMNKAKTLKFVYEILNKEAPDKAEKTLGMQVLLKGEKHFFEFTTPADMKGTKALILSPTQMYVYLPSAGKVRTVASHTKDAGFLGLSFSQDDFATTSYGPQYTATVVSQDGGTWRLSLVPKPGQDPSYAKIELIVGKDKKVPSELKYYDAQGKNIKTETRTGYSCEGDVCTPGELKMTDNIKGSWTKLTAKSRDVNKEISDNVFTQRNLGQ